MKDKIIYWIKEAMPFIFTTTESCVYFMDVIDDATAEDGRS